MTDIVERLRDASTAPSWAAADAQRHEAADEIERLRAELATCAAAERERIASFIDGYIPDTQPHYIAAAIRARSGAVTP